MLKYFFALLILIAGQSHSQDVLTIKLAVTVAPEMQPYFMNGGRLLFHITKQHERDPRSRSEISLGITPENWNAGTGFETDTKNNAMLCNGLDKVPVGNNEKYYGQVVYKQNTDDANENVAGNLYSDADSFRLTNGTELHFRLKRIISPLKIIGHPFVKTVEIKSKYLSDFFGKPKYLKASILLPSGYFDNPGKEYPVCYRVPGLNGRYDAINGMMENKDFTGWWFSKNTPRVIYVFLDSQGPYGDTYQVDSDNNGPCGKALTEELIPAVEKMVNYKPATHMRYLAGRSTGGWVVLGLQIFYPDFFDGAWAYSPDPVDFEHYGLINIYQDASVFYNRYGFLQPGRRTIYGEPVFSMKDWIAGENVNSRTGDYRISGGQFGAYNAVFGPKGEDGLPSLMFDPVTGKINYDIARQWEKYDLKKVLEKNWATLGPKLQGKIWIWMGDMDGLYSNVATRFLQKFFDKTENPKSDARISFTAMAGHTQAWSDKDVLIMVAEKAYLPEK